jgi:ATP-dependent DNA helicase DinG
VSGAPGEPPTPPALRITSGAAAELRAAIAEVDGREVFAIGDVDAKIVTAVTVCARGQIDRVNVLLDRPRRGQVVIHNHPSGDLTPSDADMSLAHRYGESGVGFVIVDNAVRRSGWIIEPHATPEKPVDPDAVRSFFLDGLPAAIGGYEPRQAQLDMALGVADALSRGRHFLVEAGTGTGKSLAYLAPSALWAKANGARVVIATHTRALQAQIVGSDAPVLARAGLDVKVAVLQGRANYLCIRRSILAESDPGALEEDSLAGLRALLDWRETTSTGSRSEISFRLPPDLWERVESDSDLSLRHRCEHYGRCFYYAARRTAADADVLVVNHALLLVDLANRHEGGPGILPKYERVVIDEAQHLEDVATGSLSAKVSPLAVRRALYLLGRRSSPLTELPRALADIPSFDPSIRLAVERAASDAIPLVDQTRLVVDASFEGLAGVLDPRQPTRRVDAAWSQSEEFQLQVAPQVEHLAGVLDRLAGHLDAVRGALGDAKVPEAKAQPLLDLQRAIRRIQGHSGNLRAFLEDDRGRCRWLEAQRGRRGLGEVAVCHAPIDVAERLRSVLWEAVPGVVATSATLSVAGDFSFWRARAGIERPAPTPIEDAEGAPPSDVADEAVFPSPFDHFQQALLALPQDLPLPDSPGWASASARAVVEAVRASRGGAFVLCTSFQAVDHYAAALREALPAGTPILAQGDQGRGALLDRFRELHDAVLVGTDSFWEGVSVKGDGLRLVILPKLPFRVPTDPLQQARHEKLAAEGKDPFRTFTLPQAAIKLRQGYGRLIRSTTDRGVVLLLDRRVHEKSYGRVLLAALPPARRLSAPMDRIVSAMRSFYGTDAGPR